MTWHSTGGKCYVVVASNGDLQPYGLVGNQDEHSIIVVFDILRGFMSRDSDPEAHDPVNNIQFALAGHWPAQSGFLEGNEGKCRVYFDPSVPSQNRNALMLFLTGQRGDFFEAFLGLEMQDPEITPINIEIGHAPGVEFEEQIRIAVEGFGALQIRPLYENHEQIRLSGAQPKFRENGVLAKSEGSLWNDAGLGISWEQSSFGQVIDFNAIWQAREGGQP